MQTEGKTDRKIYLTFLIYFLISLFLFVLGQFGFSKKFWSTVGSPIINAEKAIRSVYAGRRPLNFKKTLGISNNLAAERIAELEGQLRMLASDQAKLIACNEENTQSKKLLGSTFPPRWKYLMARVAGFNENIILDKGTKDGVVIGAPVLAESVFIGTVVETFDNYSRVRPLFNINSKVLAAVNSPTGKKGKGIISGEGNSKLKLDKVLQEEDIKKDEVVVTLPTENIPGDLPVGIIEEVYSKPSAIWKSARVRSLVDYNKIDYVFVVIR